MNADPVELGLRYGKFQNLGVAADVCGDHKVKFLTDEHRHAISTFMLGRCLVGKLSTPPVTFGFPGGKRGGDFDCIKIVFTSGRARFRQGGVTYLIAPNGCAIYDPVKAYTFSHPGLDEQFYVHVPRTMLASRYGPLLRRPQVFHPHENGLPAIIRSVLSATFEERDLLDEVSRSRLGTTVLQLTADLLETRLNSTASDSLGLDVLLYRIKAYVAANVDDPKLSVARIAESMGCSPRYVYRAFEMENVSPGEYIRDSRLDLARRRLSVASSSESLSELAFLSGFSCYAHFSRAFKAQFGMAPRHWRQSSLNGTPQLRIA